MELNLNDISAQVVDSALKVHKQIGPGLLEHVYKICLILELEKRHLDVQAEVDIPIVYQEKAIDIGYRLDLLVESQLVVELKSVEQLLPIHRAQLLTHIKLAKKKLGLLINFNVPLIKNGIVRMIN